MSGTRRSLLAAGALCFASRGAWASPSDAASASRAAPKVSAPGEFEPQEYIWLSWHETPWLGQKTFSTVAVDVMKALTPHVKVRLMYTNERPPYAFGAAPPVRPPPQAEAEARIMGQLREAGVDVSRVEPFFYPQPYGAIQDPGPFFLRRAGGGLALADFGFDHPHPNTEAMDRNIAARLGLPTVSSKLISEGGGRQANGKGVLMLVEAVERARNPKLSLAEIEAEHRRVHGASRVIWLKHGPKDEEWGRLEDGRWAIGTGGHVDVFARFTDPSTIILAEVSPRQRDRYPVMRETWRRMKENAAVVRHARDQDGKPFRLLRTPLPDPMIARASFDAMTRVEQSWFPGAKPGDQVEYYLPGGYLNYIIANGVVVTARLWEPGRDEALRESDRLGREALARAFPDRRIVQVGVTPLLHDGAGLHCHSRNQPFAA